jgi:Tol biopolymer transport system component
MLLARPFDAEALKFTGEAVPLADDVVTFAGGEVAAFDVSKDTLVYRKGAQSESARTLVWIDRTGKASNPIIEPIQPVTGPVIRLSSDGKRIVFSTPIGDAPDDIWSYDLERHVRLRLTTDPNVDHVPMWSPDGARVVFDSHRGGQGSALYEISSNGAVPERVLLKMPGADYIAASDWSRDGRFLVFHKSPAGAPPWSLWVLPVDGDAKPFPYKESSADNIAARLSPNGRWLAYITNESGSYQVVVQPFPDPAGG